MRQKTKHRIAVACIGAPLSVLAAFVGAGLTYWFWYFRESGMQTPEDFGWLGLFLMFGCLGLVVVTPALSAMLVCAIVRCTPLGVYALLSTLLSFVLGCTALVICFITSPKDITYPSLMVAGATCLLIVAVVETLMWKTLQNQRLEHHVA
jgi:hypothetical protein